MDWINLTQYGGSAMDLVRKHLCSVTKRHFLGQLQVIGYKYRLEYAVCLIYFYSVFNTFTLLFHTSSST
jgi:hypothetical protein